MFKNSQPPAYEEVIPIISDAGLASKSVGDGKMMPVLILDTSKRPDVEHLIKNHITLPSGDATTAWARIKGQRDSLALIFNFSRPSELSFVLVFEVEKQGILIDSILKSRGVYLQAGRKGDRFVNTMENPKVVVEVPDTGFSKKWGKIWEESIVRSLRKKGMSKKQAKKACPEVVSEIHKFTRSKIW